MKQVPGGNSLCCAKRNGGSTKPALVVFASIVSSADDLATLDRLLNELP